jgi:hypothetical protein
MRRVLHRQQALQLRGELLPVRRGRSQQIHRSTVIVAPMELPQAETADCVGCGDTSKYG